MTTHDAETPSGLDSTPSRTIARRSVLAGGALAVPAIALMVSTPAFAASGTTVAFNRSSYSGTGCSTISGASVAVTRNGAGEAGQATTVLLSNQWSFSDGSTSYTGTTDGNGSMAVPDIRVPTAGASGTITASVSGQSASASLSGSAATDGKTYNWTSEGTLTGPNSVGGTNATAVGYKMVLGTDGTLYHDGNVVAGPVASVTAEPVGAGLMGATFIAQGNGYVWNSSGLLKSAGAFPSGTKAVGNAFFVTPDGTLYHYDTVVAGPVASAFGQYVQRSNSDDVSFVLKNGKAYTWSTSNGGTLGGEIVLNPGAEAVGHAFFVNTDNVLYYYGTQIAGAVESAAGSYRASVGEDFVSFVDGQGRCFTWSNSGNLRSAGTHARGTVSLGTNFFRTPDGHIYYGTQQLSGGASSAIGQCFLKNGSGAYDAVTWFNAPAGCTS